MNRTIEIFSYIAKNIPRCSHHASKMQDFIISYAKERGFSVQSDRAGNILCQKEPPRVCLQSHYDMVCVGDTQKIELEVRDGWLCAKNSSLGADNGIGVAMMLSLMDSFSDAEYLFTADEEVGLLGAKNIELAISSNKVINLDSEEEGAIYVACAGGVETGCVRKFETISVQGDFYKVSLLGLPGGHSGIDIDKNIPNAIILLASKLKSKKALIASFEGGEKRNSIPANARAVVCLEDTSDMDGFLLTKVSKQSVVKESDRFLESICGVANGVLDFDLDLGVPSVSSNLSLLSLKDGECSVRISSRAMSEFGLKSVFRQISGHFEEYGYECEKVDEYEPWEWSADDFSLAVKMIYKKYFYNANFKAIHAGLECAALKKSFKDASFVSVGPNILSPHTLGERVEIESVEKSYEAIFELLRQIR